MKPIVASADGPEPEEDRWQQGSRAPVPHRAIKFLALTAGAAVLALGRDFLAPVALAGLLAFVLEPVVRRLERAGLPSGVSSVLSVVLLGGIAGFLVFSVFSEVSDFSKRLPDYRENLLRKVATLRETSLGSPLAAAKADLENLTQDDPKPNTPTTKTAGTPSGTRPGAEVSVAPVLVEVAKPRGGLLGSIVEGVGPLLAPLGYLGLVLVLAAFLLSYRADLRDRVVRLTDLGEIALTTRALDEAAQRVSRYLVSMLAVNGLYGAVLVGAFTLIGLPNALLWGLLAGALRFLPYVGTWIGAALPTLVALAVFDGWAKSGLTLGSVLVTDIVLGNVIEPLIYGKRTGLTPWAVVLATLFWTWMWGIPGLLLAVPLTLVLVVVARYVPALRWIEILLGNSAPLAPHERVYQRLLALDADGAQAVVEEVLRTRGMAPAFDEVLLPALAQAGRDRARGRIDMAALVAVRTGTASILAELEVAAPPATKGAGHVSVLCVPAGDASDALAASMLCETLKAAGMNADHVSHKVLSGEMAEHVHSRAPDVVCVLGVAPFGTARARHTCRRIREQDARVPIVAMAFESTGETELVQRSLAKSGAQRVVTSIAAAGEEARGLLPKGLPSPAPPIG